MCLRVGAGVFVRACVFSCHSAFVLACFSVRLFLFVYVCAFV